MQSKSIPKILKVYMAKNLMTQEKFATLCGISKNSVVRYMHGRPIHQRIAMKIEKATKGEIKATELLGL